MTHFEGDPGRHRNARSRSAVGVRWIVCLALAAAWASPQPQPSASAQQAVAAAKTLAARLRSDRASAAKEASATAVALLKQHRQAAKDKPAGSVWGACALARAALLLDPENASARETLGYVAASGVGAAGGWTRNPAVREDLAAAILEEDADTLVPARKRVLAFVRSTVGRFATLAKDCAESRALVAEGERAAYGAVEADVWRTVFALEPANRQARDAVGCVTVEGRSYSKDVAAVVAKRKEREAWYQRIAASNVRPADVATHPAMKKLGDALGRTCPAAADSEIEVTSHLGREAAQRFVVSGVRAVRLMEAVTGVDRLPERTGALRFWHVPSLEAAEDVVGALALKDGDERLADVRKYVSTGIAPGLIVTRSEAADRAEESVVLYSADRIVGRVTAKDTEWLSEGLLLLAKLRVLGRADTFYGAVGSTAGSRGVGDGSADRWRERIRMLAETDTDPPVASLPGRPLSALRTAELAKSWSVIEYLVERDPAGAGQFLGAAEGSDLADTLRTSVGGTAEELDEAHRAWVVESR